MSNSSAKENADIERKNKEYRMQEYGIQDESQKCQNFIDSSLFNIQKYHSNEIIMAHININSLGREIDMLTNSAIKYIEALMISETKLEDTFPHAIQHLKDFSNSSTLDRNFHGGGILVYVTDNIPSNLVKLDQKFENFESFFIEL